MYEFIKGEGWVPENPNTPKKYSYNWYLAVGLEMLNQLPDCVNCSRRISAHRMDYNNHNNPLICVGILGNNTYKP